MTVSPTHDLRKALEGIADDYMTSERHHPGYVLIPTAKFEQLCAAEKLLPPKPQCGAYPECACVAEGICGETETLAHPQQGGERDGWKPGDLAINVRYEMESAYPAFGESAFVQRIEEHYGHTYLCFGPEGQHTYLSDRFDKMFPTTPT